MDQHVDAFQATECLNHRKRQVIQIEWIEKSKMESIFIEARNYTRRSVCRRTNVHCGIASSVSDPLCSDTAIYFIGIRDVNFREWNAAFSRTLKRNERTAVDLFTGFANNGSSGAAI